MIISTSTNNQAYLTTQNTVTADVNKPNTTVNSVDERVSAVVEDESKQNSFKIAERLAERSKEPATQQKEALDSIASLQTTKSVLSDMETVATQLNEAIDQDASASSTKSKEKVIELRAELKDLNSQLKDVQSDDTAKVIVSDDKEVTVKFNSNEISSIAETLSKIELSEDSVSMKEHLSGEKGLMNQIAQTRSELQALLQDVDTPQLSVDSRSVKQSSEISKSSMLNEVGAKQLSGTSTSADVAVSILS